MGIFNSLGRKAERLKQDVQAARADGPRLCRNCGAEVDPERETCQECGSDDLAEAE